jgi:hypothetical protein
MRKAPFFERNSATMMFGSNDPPAFTEKKRSLKRRLYPVRAPFEFHNDPNPEDPTQKQKVPEAELMADLTTDAALAAVAVRMVEGAKRLRENDEWTLGLEMDEQKRLEFYESEADAMADFTRACIEPDPNGAVALDDLEMGYDGYAVEHDHPSKARNSIKGEIERSRDIQIKRSNPRSWTEDESRPTVYKGIRFTEEAAKYLPEHAFWEQYDIENPHDTGDEDGVSESVEFTPVKDLEPGRHDVRVTVKNVREDPAPWLYDQGVVGDDSDVIRYEIPEGEELEDGSLYHLFDAVVQPDEADLKLQIIPGMTDVRFIETGERDDDQEPMDDPHGDDTDEDTESDGEDADPSDLPDVVHAHVEQNQHRSVTAIIANQKGIDMNDRDAVEALLADVRGFDVRDGPDRDMVENELRDTAEYLGKMKDTGAGASIDVVVKKVAGKLNAEREYVEHVVEKMKRRGDMYELADGRVRTT